MFLIVDTNVLFAFFHSKSKVEERFRGLREKEVTLVVPRDMFNELLDIKPEILKYCKLSEMEFLSILALLLKFIKIIPKEKYEEFLEEAKKMSPDLKDAPLFALSLAFDRTPI